MFLYGDGVAIEWREPSHIIALTNYPHEQKTAAKGDSSSINSTGSIDRFLVLTVLEYNAQRQMGYFKPSYCTSWKEELALVSR